MTKNRQRVATWLGANHLQTCHQVHSNIAVFINAPLEERPKADGLVTTTPGIALAALAADCVPILLEDTEAAIIGACHAGWRGAVTGIIDATVKLMLDTGAANIRAAIGPCIGPDSYEVQSDFEQSVLSHDASAAEFFRRSDRLTFDLPNYTHHRLSQLDVSATVSGRDTYAEPDALFSYRYASHSGLDDYGRNISAIALPR